MCEKSIYTVHKHIECIWFLFDIVQSFLIDPIGSYCKMGPLLLVLLCVSAFDVSCQLFKSAEIIIVSKTFQINSAEELNEFSEPFSVANMSELTMHFFNTYKSQCHRLKSGITRCKRDGKNKKLDAFIKGISKKLIPQIIKFVTDCAILTECIWTEKFDMNIIHIMTIECLLDSLDIPNLNSCQKYYMKRFTWILNRARQIFEKFLS